ncbi:DUF2637 domain-containing protein [Streptomyces canus]|uniref:DUF2637 domain-containing protein n=1 Tax=Streptomyces canus TaxID=58343 RepID=UPI0027D7FE8E|nr:DUF2637 domain-containing protein [Streptomyces canus]
MAGLHLTRLHWILIGVVVAGATVIAAIGFSGSYAAVRELAEQRGFGGFAPYFPIGIDAGIIVLLALDLLLTWIRIPFPLLRQTAWLLTAATIAFNGAAAWPDPLGVGMHAVIPVLFIVAVEAARHAIGRIADLTADKHMEGVRFSRWLLSPIPTFLLWRRMKLWELRSYDHVVRLEQDRLVYQARLRARFGRTWRRKAPVDAMTPLRLAKYGVPLAQTGPAGLAAAGITTPAVFFADIETFTADNARTTRERSDGLSVPADNDTDVMSAGTAPDADNAIERLALSASSARMSAPAADHRELDRADNSGQSHRHENPQDSRHVADELVRPGIPLRPLTPVAAASMSTPDNSRADIATIGSADNQTPDKPETDNRADKTADNTPLVADSGADNLRADNTGADKNADNKPPRGAIAAGVRSQLAVGVTDAQVITERLSQALGLDIDKKTVARVVRREQSNAATPEPEPSSGPYL